MPLTPADASAFEAEASSWCRIPTESGRVLRTNSSGDRPAGSLFVAVDNTQGAQVAKWLAPTWGAPETAAATMRDLLIHCGAQPAVGNGHVELVLLLARGQLRAALDGTHVRLVVDTQRDHRGEHAGEHSGTEVAYWDVAEWVAEPEEVMGAILGGAATLCADPSPDPSPI